MEKSSLVLYFCLTLCLQLCVVLADPKLLMKCLMLHRKWLGLCFFKEDQNPILLIVLSVYLFFE